MKSIGYGASAEYVICAEACCRRRLRRCVSCGRRRENLEELLQLKAK
jgi:hypothetical protein